jgi:HD-GYP domain-containing protein (c-di-GMP phosphodiesterase class II)
MNMYEKIRERVAQHLSDTTLKKVVTQEIRTLLAERPEEVPAEQFCSTVACLILKEIARQTDSSPKRPLVDADTPDAGNLDYDVIVSGLLAAAQYDLVGNNLQMVRALGQAIAERDTGTGEHNTKVTLYAVHLGEKAGLSRKQIQALIKGAFLHDVGKIGIPDAVLLKTEGLSDQEYHIMKSHPRRGVHIIEGIIWLQDAHDVVLCHHERWDGSGYPCQLSGTEIPVNARIFAIADVFDALTSVRPYKPEYGFEESVSYIAEKSSTHFDPGLCELFLQSAAEMYYPLKLLSEEELEQETVNVLHEYFGLDPRGRYIGPWLKAVVAGDS